MNWFSTLLTWYFYLFVLGLIFVPLTKKLFGRYFDFGYPFAKTVGIIIASYTIFILGLINILPFTREGILLVLLIFFLVNYRKFRVGIWQEWQTHPVSKKLLWIFEELLFFVSLLFLAFIRGQEPSIRGLEKFMDFGFMNSILRSNYFPPLDMWLSANPTQPSGYPINYYYFGHLTGAFLIKLSNIKATIGYNLILATILAQGMTLSFSLSANIIYFFKKYVLKHEYINTFFLTLYGLLGAFLVNFAGNLHTIYLFTKGYPNENPVPFWTIFQSGKDIVNAARTTNQDFITAMFNNSKYWYPNATRFIPFTIHEFPSYSYVVADLHGHVFDIPYVILTLALLFNLFCEISLLGKTEIISNKKLHSFVPSFITGLWRSVIRLLYTWNIHKIADLKLSLHKFTLIYVLIIGFMASVHYMTNAFDGPIYLLLTLLILFALYKISINFVVYSFTLAGSFFIFSHPFSMFFTPFVTGIGVNCSPEFLVKHSKIGPFLFEKGNCQISPLWMLIVLWGFFWISALMLSAVLYFIQKTKTQPKETRVVNSIDIFVLLIFAFGTFLILIPEFFYIKDIYPAHFRANTMFKLGYQAYMMMSIMVVYALYRIKLWRKTWKYIPVVMFTLLFILVFLYPFFAFPSYYPGLYESATYKKAPQLDGMVWMANQYPEDLEIINYLNSRVAGQPVILEAQGDSYTDFERISAYTGLPTVAGWWVHEWLWRGSADVVGKRIPDINDMYESENIELTKQLLKKYNVSYVVVSGQEKNKYTNLKENKFSKLGVKIFESGNGVGALYQLK